MINPNPITEVSKSDLGRTVSYAIVGHTGTHKGTIDGLSYLKGMTFVKFADGDTELLEMYDLQWGDQPLWWDEAERQRKVAEIQKRKS